MLLPAAASASTVPTTPKENVPRNKKLDSSIPKYDGESEPGSSPESPQANSKIDNTSNVPLNPVIETDVSNTTQIDKSDVLALSLCSVGPNLGNEIVPSDIEALRMTTANIASLLSTLSEASLVENDEVIEITDNLSDGCNSCDDQSEGNENLEYDEYEPEYDIQVSCTEESSLISSNFSSDYQTGYLVASLKYK